MRGGGGGGGWSSDYSSNYGNSYGGGPVRGGGNYSQRGSGPYGGESCDNNIFEFIDTVAMEAVAVAVEATMAAAEEAVVEVMAADKRFDSFLGNGMEGFTQCEAIVSQLKVGGVGVLAKHAFIRSDVVYLKDHFDELCRETDLLLLTRQRLDHVLALHVCKTHSFH
ncbi:unnamed protein product [Oppiella nova]|uniref:Uncharacterized protein n=1 Tax=Oppiella nova TaxID=334625 RepID=A0A7R9LMU6_9ACAR|nr:unnamed protein product [Oppiella nova]CAG2165180.1 unnamed protein product [Oppiella nova]